MTEMKPTDDELRLLERIRQFCLSLPGVSERLSHGSPTFFVNAKQSFVQYHFHHHGDGKVALWCFAPPGVQETMIETEPELYFRPAYVGHLGWIGMRLDRGAPWEEVAAVIEQAYRNRTMKKRRENRS